MKAMMAAFATLAIIAVGASYGLKQAGFSSADQTSGNAVRLSD